MRRLDSAREGRGLTRVGGVKRDGRFEGDRDVLICGGCEPLHPVKPGHRRAESSLRTPVSTGCLMATETVTLLHWGIQGLAAEPIVEDLDGGGLVDDVLVFAGRYAGRAELFGGSDGAEAFVGEFEWEVGKAFGE